MSCRTSALLVLHQNLPWFDTMSDTFHLARPAFKKVYTSMEVINQRSNENLIVDPINFLDCIHNLNNQNAIKITATVPTAEQIFYLPLTQDNQRRKKYVLRKPEFASYNEGRILFRNTGDGDVELVAPVGQEKVIHFHNFTPILKKNECIYCNVYSNHLIVDDLSKDSSVLIFSMISKFPSTSE